MLDVLPQLVANDGHRALRAAIANPSRYAIEPKIDGVRGLIVFRPDRVVETRNRRGQVRDWQRHRPFAAGVRRLALRLPILWDGTVLDTELVAERFAGTMAALQGSARHGDALRVHVFDVPLLAGVDLRPLSWQDRRERLELLAQAFEEPYRLVPVVEPDTSLVERWLLGSWRASSSRIVARRIAMDRARGGRRSRIRAGTPRGMALRTPVDRGCPRTYSGFTPCMAIWNKASSGSARPSIRTSAGSSLSPSRHLSTSTNPAARISALRASSSYR